MANYQSISQTDADNSNSNSNSNTNSTAGEGASISDPSPSNRRWYRIGGILVVLFLLYNSKFCLFNRGCSSSQLCCPWTLGGTIGTCEACCHDRQCVAQIAEQPPPGEFGNAVCVTNPVLGFLPLRDNYCSAYQNGAFSQIPPEGYPVWMPSETLDHGHEVRKISMPRHIFSQDTPKPLMEQAWYFDLNEQDASFDPKDIRYNGTHLTIPSFQMLHAGYSRSYHHLDEHETGIVTVINSHNTYSVVADFPKAAFVEKYHTLTYQGIQDTSRGDYMKTLSDEGMRDASRPFNRRQWLKRSIFQAGYLLLHVYVQLEAGIDKAIAWQVRRYVKSYSKETTGGTPVTPETSSNWARHSQKAQQAIQYAKDPGFEREFRKSEQHCKHFEAVEGMEFTETSLTYPLDRPITTLSGEMVNSPVYYLGLGVGHVTFHYDASTNVLQLYLETYSHSRQYSDAKFPGPYPNGVFVSRVAEGSAYALGERDGRTDGMLNFRPPRGMGPFSRRIPIDFTLWSRPRSEVCDPSAETASFWEDIDITQANLGADSIFSYAVQAKHILRGVVRGMPCANIWMRSDYGRGTNAFGPNEIGVWVHALGEIPDEHTRSIGLAKWWDSWECFYQHKDQALCQED